jgi:hypothetical protein
VVKRCRDWKLTNISQWNLALPGPRIVYVQRRLTSGLDAVEGYTLASDDGPLEATYFISPSSSYPIASMTQTCKESRFVATKHYTLLFPASSTWFSFSADFLHLDFGRSPYVMDYDPRHFDRSIPQPPLTPANLKSSRYSCPAFDTRLATKVKNLAINNSSYMRAVPIRCIRGAALRGPTWWHRSWIASVEWKPLL